MTKLSYSVSLDKELVEKAEKICQKYGGKTSKLLNTLLKKFVEDDEKERGEVNGP